MPEELPEFAGDSPLTDVPNEIPKPKSKSRAIFIAVAVLLFSCAACGIFTLFIPSSDRTPTAQRVVDVTDQVESTAEPPEKIVDAQEPTQNPVVQTEPTELVPSTTPTTTATPEVVSSPELKLDTTIYVTGVRISPDDIPQGDPGLVVVLTGPPSRFGVIPVVIRNNTESPVYSLDLSAAARNADGSILGTGTGDDIVPSYIPPGGVAIGRVLFGSTPLEGASIQYVVSGKSNSGNIFIRGDLDIDEVNLVGGNIVGLAKNNRSKALDTTKIVVMCFDDADVPTVVNSSYTHQDRVEAGADLPFSVNLSGGEAQCGRYLVAAQGWETD